jgi:transcriptional regulator with XRE-family HTH domain
MGKQPRIHASKQPRRPHFIPEWADRRNLSQADLARELGADKSIVSRWYSGASPGVEWQQRLAALFHCDPDDLFRSPDDDWLKRFFEDRTPEEIKHIQHSLSVLFPKKSNSAK